MTASVHHIDGVQSVDVYIPEELANYALTETEVCGRYLEKRSKGNRTRPMMKILGFYLLLKAEAPESGWIQDYTKQIPVLAENFGISDRTFYTYIQKLESMKLAFREGNKIRIVGWVELGKALQINTKKRTKIKFKYDGTQKIHWWFAALDIKNNQDTQAYMVWKKVNKNSDTKNALMSAMIDRGFDVSKENDPEYFTGQLFMLYVEDFRTGTEVHDLLIHIRSDVNRGIRKIADDWGMTPQLVSYWKKQMAAQRILAVTKLSVTSEWSTETKECHLNKHCHVIWDDKLKERVWFLCDQLTVLMPWKWQEFLAKKAAA